MFMTSELIMIAEKISYEIQGTCGSLDKLLEENDVANNVIVLTYIDDRIFYCEGCGCWCEISEMSDNDQICTDCHNDQ